MSNLLTYIKPYRIPIVVSIILVLIELITELLQPLIMAKIINEGIVQADLSPVLIWGSVMIGLSLIAFIAGIFNSFFAAHVSQNYGYDLRMKLFEKIQSFAFSNFNKFPASSLITRTTNDIQQIQHTVYMCLRIMLRAPLIVIGSVVMALFVNVKVAFFILLGVPFIIIFLNFLLKKGRNLFGHVQAKLDGVNKAMRENLVNIRLVRAFIRHNYETERFTATSEQLKERTIAALRLMEWTMPILLFVMNASIIGVLWFGSIEIRNEQANVGEIVAIINYVTRITASLSIFSMLIIMFSRAVASAKRVSEVLEERADIEDINGEQSSIMTRGKVEFQAVYFRYPTTDTYVLENISFVANPGETVAILGETGSGKSSLFQLIPRLYDVNSGAVLIDDIDIRKIAQERVRKLIGYVPQETLLFSGSVKKNIAWGKEEATMEEIVKAAKAAQIHETIMSLPNQYEAIIGQKGVNLSGGQKQRLAIARALLINPKILLLDDSTSALDLRTEKRLLESLKSYPCTTLIITQKISTAMSANKIILLEDGKIISTGTHEYLLQHDDYYQQIYRSQSGRETR